MNVSIASIRKAAQTIKGRVTIAKIAAELGVATKDVRKYMGDAELRREIGIDKKTASRTHDAMIDRMSNAQVFITRHRLAALSKTSSFAVREWIVRHRCEYPEGTFTDMSEWRHHLLEQRIRWYCTIQQHCGKRPLSLMADTFGVSRGFLYRFVRARGLHDEIRASK